MKELCSSGFHYPLAPLLRLWPWGTREGKLFQETLWRLNISILSHRKLQRERISSSFPNPLCGTCFSEGKLIPSAPNSGHGRQSGQFQRSAWGCGSGSPHRGVFSPCWGTGTQHRKSSCTQLHKLSAQSCKLQLQHLL